MECGECALKGVWSAGKVECEECGECGLKGVWSAGSGVWGVWTEGSVECREWSVRSGD